MEFSHRSGRDLVNMAKKRTNVIPIIEDARHPAKYRMLVGMVDVIFSDVAQPDQVCFLQFLSLLAYNFKYGETRGGILWLSWWQSLFLRLLKVQGFPYFMWVCSFSLLIY